MLSIDEAIEKYKEITNTDANCPAHCNISCDKCVQESGQLAEWLEELKIYQQHEIICNKGYNAGYNKAIDDFVNACEKQLTTMYGQRYVDMRDIVNIAEQLKAGGTNE